MDIFIFDGFKEIFPFIDFMSSKNMRRYNNFLYRKSNIYNINFPKIKLKQDLNILKLLVPKERQQSKIIGNLINPNEKHGCGNIFLQLFFEYVLNDPDFIYVDDDNWIITVEKTGRYDIRIRNQVNSKIIIIENKSEEAGDQPNQLYRYWYSGIYKPQSVLSKSILTYKKILYLSPEIGKRPDSQTVLRPKNYEITLPESVPKDIIKIIYFNNEIVEWLSACMATVDKYSEMYYCLKQYQDYWRFYYGKDY
jgi:hypothetical protein